MATSTVVGLRIFQRVYSGVGLQADDYLIIISWVCVSKEVVATAFYSRKVRLISIQVTGNTEYSDQCRWPWVLSIPTSWRVSFNVGRPSYTNTIVVRQLPPMDSAGMPGPYRLTR